MAENQGTASGTVQTPGQEIPGEQNLQQNPKVGSQGATAGSTGIADPTKSAAQEAMRKLKIKHQDGKEEEVPEEEVLKVYRERKGHQAAANKELQEGRALRKQNEAFIQMMKDKGKLFEAIQKLGHDPRKLAEEYLAAQLEEELMDPREKELKAAKTRLQQYEEMEKRQKAAAQERIDNELKEKFAKDYSEQFVEALKSTNLPPTKEMVSKMATYISRAAKMKFQMTALEAAKLVREDVETAQRNLFGNVDAETLIKLLGDEGLKKVRTYDTSKLKDPMSGLQTPQEQADGVRQKRQAGERMTSAQWRMHKFGK